MTSRALAIGLDVGTSAVKAVAIDATGSVIAQESAECSFESPRPGWAETSPDQLWEATKRALRGLCARDAVRSGSIASVGLTGQMHGLVVLDSRGRPIRPAIMWNDQRCASEVQELEESLGLAQILALTGNKVLTGFTAPKWMWLARHEPETVRAAAHIMLPKDYVRFRLTGAMHTDVSDASGTLFFDCEHRRWSSAMCDAIGLRSALLPEVFESPSITSRVTAEGARDSGLPEGTPVAAGAGDQAAQAVGTGIVREGDVSCTIGTSGVIFAATAGFRPTPDGSLHAFCHAIPDRWHLMGVTLSAGGSLRWMRDSLCADLVREAATRGCDPYELMLAEAAAAPAGCEGLVFLPYLSGERTPHADPNARGVFAGLSTRSTRRHMIRAVVEGVTCSLRETLDLARSAHARVDRVRLSGGGARSAWWRQLLCDAFRCPTSCPTSTDGAALGAAMLGGVGVGIWPSVDAAADTVTEASTLTPSESAPEFDAIADRYARCRQAMTPWFAHSR